MNFGPFLPFCILSCGEARRRVGCVPWLSDFGMISAIVRLRPRRWENGVRRARHTNQNGLCQEGKGRKGQRVQVVMKCDCGKVVAAWVLVLECWVLAGLGSWWGFWGSLGPSQGYSHGRHPPGAGTSVKGNAAPPSHSWWEELGLRSPRKFLSLNLNPMQSRDVYCAKITT